MQNVLIFLAVVGGSVALSVILLQAFRRVMPRLLTTEDHQIAGHFLGAVAGFYGVLLAFVVVIAWGQFQDAKIIVTREANQAGDLFRLTRFFPEPAQSNMRASVIAYDQVVVTKEWPEMAARGESKEAWTALDNIWNVYGSFQPQAPPQALAYELSLARLTDLSDARRLRLLASREKVPGVLWGVLIMGGVISIFFTYLFRLQHVLAQVLMTASLAGLIAFILFLVMEFDAPFSGAVRVKPEVFERELQRMGAPVASFR
jgi:hypothetical protein